MYIRRIQFSNKAATMFDYHSLIQLIPFIQTRATPIFLIRNKFILEVIIRFSNGCLSLLLNTFC